MRMTGKGVIQEITGMEIIEDQEITEVARGIPARNIGTTNREEEIEAFPKTREIPHPQEITTKEELTT